MHRIDRKWTSLAAGYRAIQSFNTRLAVEFGRAVRVGHKQQFRKELNEWQKKRQVFFTLAVIAPLSIIALCLTAFYFREVACVIIYWALLVLIILGTLAVAGRQYIKEVVNGKPLPQHAEGLEVDLEGRWWESLAPREITLAKAGKNEELDFLTQLSRSLPDSYAAQSLSKSGVLLLGPTGIWTFTDENWSGTVVKQEGTWKQIQIVRNKIGRKRSEEVTLAPGPDENWLQQKTGMVTVLEKTLPEQPWILNLVQGGVVFSHPKVNIDKKHILGNTASYGRPKAWVERIRQAPPEERLTQEMQLEILDDLAEPIEQQTVSAEDEAERLYQQAVEELRAAVSKMVK